MKRRITSVATTEIVHVEARASAILDSYEVSSLRASGVVGGASLPNSVLLCEACIAYGPLTKADALALLLASPLRDAVAYVTAVNGLLRRASQRERGHVKWILAARVALCAEVCRIAYKRTAVPGAIDRDSICRVAAAHWDLYLDDKRAFE